MDIKANIDFNKIQDSEMKISRSIKGCYRLDKIRNEVTNKLLKISNITKKMENAEKGRNYIEGGCIQTTFH